MSINRRKLLGSLVATGLGASLVASAPAQAQAPTPPDSSTSMRRIATEEAFSTPKVMAALREAAGTDSDNLDMNLVRGMYMNPELTGAQGFLDGLIDLEQQRLAVMDENNVDMHLLSLTAPGVQLFETAAAGALATDANDILADVISRHPLRFAGLASFAPQDPAAAVREMERAVKQHQLNGFVVNSHTNNEYLDLPKYWPILDAAQGLDRAIYIHPRAPADGMSAPFRDYGLDTAIWGYGMETSTHAIRMIVSGVFDEFPDLKIILGHMGEGIPYWLWRVDYMYRTAAEAGRMKKLKMLPSEYFKRNFVITTSGAEDPLVLDFAIKKIGAENIMWAIDYPYQPTTPAVEFMNSAPLSTVHKHAVFHGNAERVFHIEPLKTGLG